MWNEPIALWSGAPRPVSGRWEFGLYPDQGAGGSLSSPAVTLLISATDEKAQEKDLLCSVYHRPSHASSPDDL